VVNLMDALRQSVQGGGGEREKPDRPHHRAAKKSSRSGARYKKAS